MLSSGFLHTQLTFCFCFFFQSKTSAFKTFFPVSEAILGGARRFERDERCLHAGRVQLGSPPSTGWLAFTPPETCYPGLCKLANDTHPKRRRLTPLQKFHESFSQEIKETRTIVDLEELFGGVFSGDSDHKFVCFLR